RLQVHGSNHDPDRWFRAVPVLPGRMMVNVMRSAFARASVGADRHSPIGRIETLPLATLSLWDSMVNAMARSSGYCGHLLLRATLQTMPLLAQVRLLLWCKSLRLSAWVLKTPCGADLRSSFRAGPISPAVGAGGGLLLS